MSDRDNIREMEGIKITPKGIYGEYTKLKEYCAKYALFDIVQTNEKFYYGEQWEGINAPNLPQPVFNVLQRIVKYMISMIVSDDISVSYETMTDGDDKEAERKAKLVSKEIEKLTEICNIKRKAREFVRNGAVDGSAYFYAYFDADVETGQEYKGQAKVDVTDNTNVFYGNPYSEETQSQPYITISMREYIHKVRREARENGVENWDLIKPDNEGEASADDSDELVTVLIKFWKQKIGKSKPIYDEFGNVIGETKYTEDEVWFIKTTQDVLVTPEPINTEMRLYPIVRFAWDNRRDSYLGISPMTANINNQIFINQSMAMAQLYEKQNAFPAVLYDSSKLANGISGVTKVGVKNMDLLSKLIDSAKAPDFSDQIFTMIDKTVEMTKSFMGASDSALGDIEPENTSAIIAVQQATSAPLEIQKLQYYDAMEELIRVLLEIMIAYYGVRMVKTEIQDPVSKQMVETMASIDYDSLRDLKSTVKIDIGNSAYYSELAQVSTVDNLFNKGVIPDPLLYVEMLPTKYIPKKAKLEERLREILQQQMQQPVDPTTGQPIVVNPTQTQQ